MMQLITYDNDRLELAKEALPNIVDKQHFLSVRKELTYKSNKRELKRFFHSQMYDRRNDWRRNDEYWDD